MVRAAWIRGIRESPSPMAFTDRIARELDHPIDAACAARAPGTVTTSAVGAGIGAGIGAVLGGALFAGIGGGTGALVGYVVAWLRIRGAGLSLAMALVLAAEQLELHRLSFWRPKPAGLVRAIAYSEITDVQVRNTMMQLRVAVITAGEPLLVETGKRGVGAGGDFVAALRRRIAT
jgi:hypothetical protein